MEQVYNDPLPHSEKLNLYRKDLFINLREAKLWLSILAFAIAVFEIFQVSFVPQESRNNNLGLGLTVGASYIIAAICYYTSVFKDLRSNNSHIYKLRYCFLFLSVVAYTIGVIIRGFVTNEISKNVHEKNYISIILDNKSEIWLVLLIDLFIPIWYFKLIVPLALWAIMIMQYYQTEMKDKDNLWIKLVFSFIYIICIFMLKAKIQWKSFLNNLNFEEWYQIQKRILDKIPDSVGIIDDNLQTLYSNTSFKSLCNNNIKDLGQKIIDVRKITETKTEKENPDTNQIKLKVYTDDTKQIFINDDYRNQDTTNVNGTFLNLTELLEEMTSSFFNNALTTEECLIFTGKCLNNESCPPCCRSYEIKLSPMLSYKKIMIIINDTTQNDKAASLEGVNQYKDKLLATVSHDLRAPINGTLTFIENTIDDEDVPSSIKQQFLIPAQRSCQFLLHLVNDILDFSQINAQKLRMTYEDLSIVETIKSCHQLLEVQANHKKIALPIELDKSLPLTFATDHNRISQIIINLLTNAIKFTSKGEVKLSVKSIEDSLIEISVSDTGIGIKQEDQKKLFRDFTRIEYDQPNLNKKGVGLGLVIANQLARMLGPSEEKRGGIKVFSVYGKGSTFKFVVKEVSMVKEKSLREEMRIKNRNTLQSALENHGRVKSSLALALRKPFLQQRTGEMTVVEFNTMVNFPPLTKFNVRHPNSGLITRNVSNMYKNIQGKVLIVDDDPFNILAIESLLKRYGLDTDSVYNGQEAIERIRAKSAYKAPENMTDYENPEELEEGYDIIFMDCEMPIMNGLETAVLLTKMMERGEIETVPIVGCTGHRGHEDVEKCYESGMVDVLSKPVSRERLKECLKDFLEINI